MGTLVCTIELDKNAGLTVTVDNADANIKQIIALNGTTIQLKVQGASATSTITQDAEKIAIACKQFEVQAEQTVTVKSGQASDYEAGSTMTVKSTGQMTVSTPAQLALEGKTQAGLSGATTEVKADGSLSLQSSGIATLKGALTNVQGNLVNLG